MLHQGIEAANEKGCGTEKNIHHIGATEAKVMKYIALTNLGFILGLIGFLGKAVWGKAVW